MTRDECVKLSRTWLEIADRGYRVDTAIGGAANTYARPAVAAAIAQVYATLAISAERDGADDVLG